MANSKYAYVKTFEVEDNIMFPNLIIIRVEGRDFQRFWHVNDCESAYDERGLKLMNSCACSVLEEHSDIIFAYGFISEYSFVLKKKSDFYQRRSSKILSIVTSLFSSTYATKWKEHFPEAELKYPPSFLGKIIVCASLDVLQHYLTWRQYECYMTNLYSICAQKLLSLGKSEEEVLETLRGTRKQDRHGLLLQQFNINYNTYPVIFRWGSFAIRAEVEKVVKYKENGSPVRRLRKETKIVHSESISRRAFWNENPSLLSEVGVFLEDIDRINQDYVRSFNLENKLMPCTWVVIRIDGCHFHKFTEIHEFEKPNDEQALKLMSSCAASVLEEFSDIVFAYGHSDEYSFVLKKNSRCYQRNASYIVSAVVSFFSSAYVMKWKAFFPNKELVYPPSFDGRAICYPSREILHDYLTWRQVDCHINNQYNTCFWMLVKSGHGKSEAQRILKGTQTQDKLELLTKKFGIVYSEIKEIFRLGSSAFWAKNGDTFSNDNCTSDDSLHTKVVVEHCNIIDHCFWKARPNILGESDLTSFPF